MNCSSSSLLLLNEKTPYTSQWFQVVDVVIGRFVYVWHGLQLSALGGISLRAESTQEMASGNAT